MKTTLNAIRKHEPCANGWKKLMQYLGKTEADDEPLLISTILKSNGLDDALWCLRAVDGHDKEIRLLALAYGRKVQHLMTDPRSIAALDVAERHANGQASYDELAAAGAAAWDAAGAVDAAGAAARAAGGDAAWDAAMDAEWDATWAAARAAARAAGGDAAWDAARAAARAAAGAVDAARDAAGAAGGDANMAVEQELQTVMLINVCKSIEDTEK